MNAWIWAALGVMAVAGYLVWWLRRNYARPRPQILDRAGRPLRLSELTYSDGERVSLVEVGEGPTLLLVPGADGIKETFSDQISALAAGHRLVCADLRARFGPGDTFDRLAEDLAELSEAFRLGAAAVIGQSLGGAIAMRYAVLHPERVRALVVVNSLTRVSREHLGLNRVALIPVAMATIRYLPTFLARLFARLWSRLDVWIFDNSPGRERVVEYAMRITRTVPAWISSGRVRRFEGVDLRPQLEAISAPTLVIKGPVDHYCPPSWSREIAALIPNATYEEIDGTGHCSHVSRPDAFNRLVLEWLARVDGEVKT